MLWCDLYLVFRNSTIMSVYHHFLKNKTVNVVPLIQYTDFTKFPFSNFNELSCYLCKYNFSDTSLESMTFSVLILTKFWIAGQCCMEIFCTKFYHLHPRIIKCGIYCTEYCSAHKFNGIVWRSSIFVKEYGNYW